tara:strand:- start:1206 stop:1706 length:501 start_codon:yes stop_codon:yes gene_type:complete
MTTETSDHAVALTESEHLQKRKPARVTREPYGERYIPMHSSSGLHRQSRSKISHHLKEKALENAQKLWLLRRNREAMFSASGHSLSFGEPIWDMLLDLYISETIGRKISISSLCLAAHVPQTTALRYLGEMLDARLVLRVDDPKDLRRSFVELSDDAFELLTKLLA